MPAQIQRKSPDEQLRLLARFAQAQGLNFDEFWDRATSSTASMTTPPARRPVGGILWPSDSHDRKVARAAVAASRETWMRVYTGSTLTRPEAALASLAA